MILSVGQAPAENAQTNDHRKSHSTDGRLAEHEIVEIAFCLKPVAWPTSETVQVPEYHSPNVSLQNLREPCSLLEFEWPKIRLSGPRSNSPCA